MTTTGSDYWALTLQERRAIEMYSRWGLKVIYAPTVEPITLTEAKLHLRIDDDGGSPPAHPDDALITGLITAAREWCEFYSGLALAPQVLEMGGRAFDPASAYRSGGMYCSYYIELPMSPVYAIQSVGYVDEADVMQTVPTSDYVLDDYCRPPRLYAAASATWPAAKANTPNAARIRYQAGFDLPGSSPNPNPVPQSAIAAIKLMLTHLYENRSAVEQGSGSVTLSHELPLGAKSLLDVHRLRMGLA